MSSAGVALSPAREDPVRFDGSRSPHCSLESILIYLTVPGSPMIPMRVLDSDSIASVKLRIQSCRGFVGTKQRLVFDGRELARNNSLVRDYGVADGGVLHLVICFSDLRLITVRTASGRTLELQVERGRNVGYLKEQIARRNKEFGNVSDQKLICDGEELDDRRVIDDVCKHKDAVIHLFIRKSAKVSAKLVDKDFEISIEAPEPGDELGVVAHEPIRRAVSIEPFVVNPKAELSPVVKDMVCAASDGLDEGHLPVMSSEGSGGAYFMRDVTGHKYVGVFKPMDEEPMAENNPRGLPVSVDGEGMKRGTRVGEGALREVAAYILDHPINGRRSNLSEDIGFSGVPPTVMVRCVNSGFNQTEGYEAEKYKIGSLQMFVKNQGSCEDMGPRAFPVDEVHKIAVMDIRLANADRHAGNILICKEEGRFFLVPIDHGYCLPENFEDCTFEWLYWPQAKEQFNSETIDYIRSLDAEEHIALLKFHGWDLPLECARVLRISTMLLKKGVERGLSPYDIGSIMCRETLKKQSVIEEIVHEAMDAVLPGSTEATFLEAVSDIMDHRLDKLSV